MSYSRKAGIAGRVCGTLVLGLAGAVNAQDAEELPEGTESGGMAEVKVTGSRIQRDGMSSPTPVTAVTSTELQKLAPTTLIAALDQLPQFTNNSTPATTFSWSGNSGASILNLRGIGSNRTLTLLDGRRVVPSTRLGSTDVGIFPEPLVRRVEVVTGGASAAYGSDAVAGVVNFILDTDFTGLKADVQGGISDRSDGENYKVSVSGGRPIGERAHLILSADYFRSSGIADFSDRDWFQSWGVISNPRAGGPRLIVPNVHSRIYTPGGLITFSPLSGSLAGTQFLDDGSYSTFQPGSIVSGAAQVGGDGVDIGPVFEMNPTTKRGSLFAHLKYDINDDTEAYVQGMFGYSFSNFAEAPNHLYGAWEAKIYQDNAYLPEELRQRMIDENLPFVPFGRSGANDLSNIRAEMENKTSSFTTGLKGKLGTWRYNAYYQYGQNDQRVDLLNVPRIDRLFRSMDAIVGPNGDIICRSTLTFPDDGCVPSSFFGQNAVTGAAHDYMVGGKAQVSLVKQHFAEATIDGEVFEGWAGPVSLAFGASYRKDSVDQHGDPIGGNTGDPDCTPTAASQGYQGLPAAFSNCYGIYERASTATVVGSFNVKEVFTETLVPLVKGAPLVDVLDLSLAARYADYSGSGGVVSWKGGLEWMPYSDLRLRGTVSRDTRAGSLAERFDRSFTGATADDPFLGDINYAFSQIQGGDPTVDPEKADTKVLGLVYQPSWLPGFGVSVDYFDIQIDGAISSLGVQNIVDRCFEGATDLCSRISRGADGRITTVLNTFLNVNEARTTGVDIEASYRTSVSFFGGNEQVTVRAFFSQISELSTTVTGSPKDDNAGQTGLGGGAPDWRGTVSLGYTNGPFSLNVQERWISEGTYDASWIDGVDIVDNTVSPTWYTNLRLGYGLESFGQDTELFLNVSNVFDRDPVLAPSYSDFFGSSHTNEALFDEMGRTYVLGVKMNF